MTSARINRESGSRHRLESGKIPRQFCRLTALSQSVSGFRPNKTHPFCGRRNPKLPGWRRATTLGLDNGQRNAVLLKQWQSAVMLTMVLKKWHAVDEVLVVFHFKLSGGSNLIRTALHDALMRPDRRVVSLLQDPKRDHEGQSNQTHQKQPHA